MYCDADSVIIQKRINCCLINCIVAEGNSLFKIKPPKVIQQLKHQPEEEKWVFKSKEQKDEYIFKKFQVSNSSGPFVLSKLCWTLVGLFQVSVILHSTESSFDGKKIAIVRTFESHLMSFFLTQNNRKQGAHAIHVSHVLLSQISKRAREGCMPLQETLLRGTREGTGPYNSITQKGMTL